LTQVIPRHSPSGYKCKDLKDPRVSIFEGAGILRSHLARANGNINVALCFYNAGPYKKYCKSYRVKKRGTTYSRKILKLQKKLLDRYYEIEEENPERCPSINEPFSPLMWPPCDNFVGPLH
jgi:soluble lytic murein transglycosylase-like protein